MHIQISSQILKPFFRKLSGSFAIWGGGARIAHLPEEEEEEELQSPEEAGVNRVYLRRTYWAMP